MQNSSSKDQKILEVVYGAHPLIELIKAGRRKINCVYTTKPYPKAWQRIAGFLQDKRIEVRVVDKNTLDKIAGCTDHMGVVALASPFIFKKEIFMPERHPQILLLDSIQDVKNLGAILRSAYCSGFSGVVLSRKGCAPITAATLKSSAGLAHHLDVYLAPSLEQALIDMKKQGYNVLMAVPNGGIDVREATIKKPLCLVIGNEEKGIKKQLFDKGCLITLPQINQDVSYNASVAAGILMFYLSYCK